MKVDRRAHILRGNRTSGYPRNMVFFDVEARPEKGKVKNYHEPYLWVGFWYYVQSGKNRRPSDEWIFANNPEEFWSWVNSRVSRKEKLYMFAHNPTYDMVTGVGFKSLRKFGFNLHRIYNENRTFIARFKSDNRSIVILNVGNFYRGSVADIGKAFGIPKLKLEYENPDFEEAVVYCKRDVEIIAKAMLAWIGFCKENDLGQFGLTAPKQSFNAFRHRFMKHKIYIHDNERAVNLERESYSGGRTEAFFIGSLKGRKVVTLDVNSMYPAVMRCEKYPTKLVTIRRDLSPEGLEFSLKNYLVCARVRVRVGIPCVVWKGKGGTIFPVGEFVTTLTTPEIQLAFSFGEVLSVEECAFYEHAPIFADFVEFFYNARLQAKSEGNKSKDLLFKLILNSLYGKFGQKSGIWEVVDYTDSDEVSYDKIFSLSEGKWITIKQFAGVVIERVDEKESYNSFPAIASHVTGYARRKLFEYILKAGLENVYYCDTDSLFVNEKGLENLKDFLDDRELGYLKNEGEKEDLVIYAPKDYEWKGGEKHKGIPKNAERIGENSWKFTQFPGLSTLIREGNIDEYFTIETTKKLHREYDKGWVTESGRVVPFEMKVVDGRNVIIPWEETSYSRMGMRLKDEAQKERVAKKFG